MILDWHRPSNANQRRRQADWLPFVTVRFFTPGATAALVYGPASAVAGQATKPGSTVGQATRPGSVAGQAD